MNVPVKWLQEFVDIDVSPQQLAARLTMVGLEAEKIHQIGDAWDRVFVGEVLDVSQHPDADRLVLADVAAGEHRLTVVTGAPNIAAGQRVALALAGARLIDGYADEVKYRTLKPGKIRGIQSEGMVCSEKELGLSGEHEGILVLSPDAPPGTPLADWLGDTVIEFEITPNLVHAFSILGVAREAAALLDKPLRMPTLANMSSVPETSTLVRVDDPDLCPRYSATIIDGLRVGDSPDWLKRRLTACGVRPINNVVDVSNYVMLELGQPTHAFDLRDVVGETITVRRSVESESIETLDHVSRELPPGTLLICDAERPIGIAGVMGGVNSEVRDTTTSILLEVATFDMSSIRRTSRHLKLRSDASSRYERGLDPELVDVAVARSVELLLQLTPGASVRATQDIYPAPLPIKTIAFPGTLVRRVLGVDIPINTSLGVLERLDFEPRWDEKSASLAVRVPSWRADVTIPEDIVEEIARMVGYEHLPATLPSGQLPPIERDPLFTLERSVRAELIAAGSVECRGYITNSADQLRSWHLEDHGDGLGFELVDARLVRLRNAIPSDADVLRPSILPNLTGSLIENLKHQRAVSLFEIGHVFLGNDPDELPAEPTALTVVMAGALDAFDRFTHRSKETVSYVDAKGIVDRLLERFGIGDADVVRYAHPALHPGRSAEITVSGQRLGIVGELHPRLSTEVGFAETRIAVVELNLSYLLELSSARRSPAVRVQRFLPVEQDFAIIVSRQTPASDVERALRQSAGPLVTNIALFDEFVGEQIGANHKSLAYRVTFTAPDRALTDAELGKVRKRIERTLSQAVGGSLRA